MFSLCCPRVRGGSGPHSHWACVGFHLAQTHKKAPGLHFPNAGPGAQEAGALQRAAVPIALPRAEGLPVGHREAPCCSPCHPVVLLPALSPPPSRRLPSRWLHSCPLAVFLQAQLASWCLLKWACVPLYVWAKVAFLFVEKVESLGWVPWVGRGGACGAGFVSIPSGS